MRRIWVLAVTVGLLLTFSSSALADNVGYQREDGTTVNFQDDNLVSYQFDTNLSANMRAATQWTLVNSYATTDLNVLRVGDGHGADWNNHYAIGAMPQPDMLGYHTCVYWATGNRCWHAHIRYRNASLYITNYERALACQETGHSVGLRHHGPTANSQSVVRCMWNPVPSTDPFVGPHNVGHINAIY
jgi:hypothetical protein